MVVDMNIVTCFSVYRGYIFSVSYLLNYSAIYFIEFM